MARLSSPTRCSPAGARKIFFRYMRHRHALDVLDTCATVADDPDRVVPKPHPPPARADHDGLAADLAGARDELAARKVLTWYHCCLFGTTVTLAAHTDSVPCMVPYT